MAVYLGVAHNVQVGHGVYKVASGNEKKRKVELLVKWMVGSKEESERQ